MARNKNRPQLRPIRKKSKEKSNSRPLETKPWGRFMLFLADKSQDERVRIWNGYQRYLCAQKEVIVPPSVLKTLLNTPELTNSEVNAMSQQGIIAKNNFIIDFENMIFSHLKDSDFQGFLFPLPVCFTRAIFSKEADFREAAFSGEADFREVTFSQNANFKEATFFRNVHFENAKFGWVAVFEGATFNANCTFDVIQPELLPSILNFDDAKFNEHPPYLFDRRLNTDSSWHRIILPKAPTIQSGIDLHQKAYERLRVLAKELGKVSDEQLFFRKEMDCKLATARLMLAKPKYNEDDEDTETKKPWEKRLHDFRQWLMLFWQIPWNLLLPWRWPHLATFIVYRLYKLTSNFGDSIVRPALGLFSVWLSGSVGWYYHFLEAKSVFCLRTCDYDHDLAVKAAGESFIHLFSSLGHLIPSLGYLVPYKPETAIPLTGWVAFWTITQTTLGLILLFLIIFAIRNRLRLR